MRQRQPTATLRSSRSRTLLIVLAFTAVLSAGAVGLFVLPWYIQSHGEPVAGDSYVLGFNNRVSYVALLATVVALFVVGLALFSNRDREQRRSLWLTTVSAADRTNRLLVGAIAALTATFTGVLIWATYGAWQWDTDSNYFLTRMMYAVGGAVPNRDLEFSYGLGLLYLPLTVYRLLHPLGVSLEAAYWITYFLTYVGGVFLVMYVTDHMNLTPRAKAAAFLALGLPWALNGQLGLSYTMLRFMTPVVLMLFFHTRVVAEDESPRAPWVICAWALAALAGGFLVALESSVAMFPSLGVYLLWLALKRKGRAWWTALGVYVVLPLLAVLPARTAFTHFGAVSSGAANYPVLPSLTMIVLLAAAFGAFALLPAAIGGTPNEERPATITIAMFSVAMVVPALARSDSIHVFFNGLAITVVAFVVLYAVWRPAFWSFLGVFVAVSIAASLVWFRYCNGPCISAHLIDSGGVRGRGARMVEKYLGPSSRNGYEKYQPYVARPETYSIEPLQGKLPIMPYVMLRDPLGVQLAEQHELISPYFWTHAYSESQLETQKRVIGSARYLLMGRDGVGAVYKSDGSPQRLESKNTMYNPDGSVKTIPGPAYYPAMLYTFQGAFPFRRTPFDSGIELVKLVQARFRPIAWVGPYRILSRVEPEAGSTGSLSSSPY